MDYSKCLPLEGERILITSPIAKVDESFFTRVHRVENYETSVEVARIAEAEILRSNATVIIARAECDLIRAAELRNKFSIRGQGRESAVAFRDKFEMKSLVAKTELRQPIFRLVANQTELRAFAQENGYPVVVKPRDGSGGVSTYILDSSLDLEKVDFGETSLLAETFASTTLFHTDGLATPEGILFFSASKYINDCLAFQRNDVVGCTQLEPSEDDFLKLKKLTETVLSALPLPAVTSFHAEFFRLDNGEFLFCEIASRSGGARIVETIEASYGLNIDELFVMGQHSPERFREKIRDLKSTPFTPSGYLLIPPQKGQVKNVPTSSPYAKIFSVRTNVPKSGVVANPSRAADSLVSFLARGENSVEVESELRRAGDWFRSSIQWEAV